jgi:hypothetical protein
LFIGVFLLSELSFYSSLAHPQSARYWAVEVDSISGAVLSQQALPRPIVTVSQIAIPVQSKTQEEEESGAHAHVIVLVDETLAVTSYPTAAAQLLHKYVETHSNKVFFFLSSLAAGTVNGYGVNVFLYSFIPFLFLSSLLFSNMSVLTNKVWKCKIAS